MKNKQINIAIAKACGLTIVSDGIMHHLTPCGKKTEHNPEGCLLKECPDYCNDLNVMHETEKVIKKDSNLWKTYESFLARIVSGDCGMFHITANQRAEAFLKTLGKWEE